MKLRYLHPEFVEFIPDVLETGVLYISTPYATASHLCACGCGQKVVTPIRPTDWTMIWDGESVELYPSIGNWNLPCRSHYWIRSGGRIEWAGDWSDTMVAKARAKGRAEKSRFFAKRKRHMGSKRHSP